MKRTIVVLLFFFALCVINAQNKQRHITPERFQAELEQYITKRQDLLLLKLRNSFQYIPRCCVNSGLYMTKLKH